MTRPPFVFRQLARRQLHRLLGGSNLDAVIRAADAAYVPPPPLARTTGGRLNLQMAAYLIALRDGMVSNGWEEAQACEVLAASLHGVMKRFYAPLELAARLLHPRDNRARGRWRQHIAGRFVFRRPDWFMESVVGSPCYAFDVRRCVSADYARSRREGAFCERVLCAQDFYMAQGRGEELRRTITLAGGADRCDFRFPGLTAEKR